MNDRTFDRISRGLATTTSRRQALKFLGTGVAAGALGTAGFNAVTAAPPAAGGGTATGTLDDSTDLGTVTQLVATLTDGGILISATSSAVGAVSGLLELAGSGSSGPGGPGAKCDVLNLDLLGLEIIINAIPGQGNLLGNLLCAVGGLLDNGGPLQGITNLLNRIFGLLG